MIAVPQVRLSGRAMRFVELLQEYGHLDSEGVNRLLLGVAEIAEHTDDGGVPPIVDVDLVRRAAAMMLFPDGDAVDAPLAEDWPLLFS